MTEDDSELSKAGGAPGDDPAGEPSFEQALAKLESIVDRLEQGDLELEVALADFEQGVKLTRRCAGELASAERRIEVLVREGEKWITQPFHDADDDADDTSETEDD